MTLHEYLLRYGLDFCECLELRRSRSVLKVVFLAIVPVSVEVCKDIMPDPAIEGPRRGPEVYIDRSCAWTDIEGVATQSYLRDAIDAIAGERLPGK